MTAIASPEPAGCAVPEMYLRVIGRLAEFLLLLKIFSGFFLAVVVFHVLRSRSLMLFCDLAGHR